MSTVVICSGGLDSVTLAWKVFKENKLDLLLSYDYGQRHRKEVDYARVCSELLGVSHKIIDLSDAGNALSGSALTDDVDVPDGHYAHENMKVTIVPNRNAIMLAVAYGVAAAMGLHRVATAVHGGDHFIYPDCRPDFIHAFESMQNYALEDFASISMYAPFLQWSKSDIVVEGKRLSVPFEKTWSCYKGGEIHCGRCGTCVERQEAFSVCGVDDPTLYEDPDYWRNVTDDNGEL